jgi:hypothetical protein
MQQAHRRVHDALPGKQTQSSFERTGAHRGNIHVCPRVVLPKGSRRQDEIRVPIKGFPGNGHVIDHANSATPWSKVVKAKLVA